MLDASVVVLHEFADGWRSVSGHNTNNHSPVKQIIQAPLGPVIRTVRFWVDDVRGEHEDDKSKVLILNIENTRNRDKA